MAGNASFDLRGFLENSLLEWEDKVSAVVIAGGCNLRCPFCHSWRYVTGLDTLKPLDTGVIFDLLERQRGWIDGVVFTGGEPTLQPGLADLMRDVREYGVLTKLHTNGTRPDVVSAILRDGLVDCLALDYKAPLDRRWLAAADCRDGGDDLLDRVRESFRLARESGIDREYHTTLAPNFVSRETFSEMASELDPDGLWILQQYETGERLNPALAGERRYNGEELDWFEETAKARHGRAILKRGKSA
ncbi:MAG: anaerobic ribonucleoside-triphosphate reductase activating protein [Planctomycetaceae bacterium]|nr:anaerobic ribonucleoside-triphosphate reductase activating protein [Planctomycetaceae bacterium]